MKKKKNDTDVIRQTLRFPPEVWERIKTIADSASPKLSANQVAVLLLDYASKDIPKIRWIFETLPNDESKSSSRK